MDKPVTKVSSIDNSLAELKEVFSFFTDPMDKFVQIIDMGKNSKGLETKDKNDSTKINGCTSQAWVKCKKESGDSFSVRTDSDTFIVRGLLNMLEKLLDGCTSEEILSINAEYILENIGLDKSMTTQRTNGFVSAIAKIHEEVKNLDCEK